MKVHSRRDCSVSHRPVIETLRSAISHMNITHFHDSTRPISSRFKNAEKSAPHQSHSLRWNNLDGLGSNPRSACLDTTINANAPKHLSRLSEWYYTCTLKGSWSLSTTRPKTEWRGQTGDVQPRIIPVEQRRKIPTKTIGGESRGESFREWAPLKKWIIGRNIA